MNRILSLLFCIVLAACTETTFDNDQPNSQEPISTTFCFGVDPLGAPAKETRSDGSVDEDIAEDTSIHDLNIYMWNEDDLSTMVHKYQASGSSITVSLVPGTYQSRIVANVGSDMGEMEPEILDQIGSSDLLSEEEQRRKPLFTAKQEIQITNFTRSFNVVLQRLYARAYIDVKINPVYNPIMSLISAEVCNIPTTAVLFGAPDGETDFPGSSFCTRISKMKRSADGKLSDVIYIYENLKPSKPLITSQEQRGKENAPAGATYIHILTQSPFGFCHYYIYLGENMTSNFTIRRNTSIKYDITIQGLNANDYRVMFTQFDFNDLSSKCDLETWPPSKSDAVFNYGAYILTNSSHEFQEGRYWAKTFTDQYSLDKGATWLNRDTTTFLPLTKQNDYGISVRDFAKSIPHPGEANASFVKSYYKDGDFCQLNNNFYPKSSVMYGYTINFKIEGMDAFSDFDLGALIGKDDKNKDVLYFLNRDYSTTGTFSIFAYPNQRTADTPHLDMSFSWLATYKFLGFFNKDGVKFDATNDPITDTATSWSTNGKGTTTVFWREANQGSGDIYLRFEKKPVALDIQMSQTNKNSTYKLNHNKITLVDASRTAPVKVQYSCIEGQGVFLRNPMLNSATGLYEGTPVVTYNQTCTFTGGKAQVPEVVFVPFVSGVVKYTVSVTDSATGSLLNEVVAANTIAKSTMDVSFDFAISKESLRGRYLEYGLPDGSRNYFQIQRGISPYKLYAYAVAKKGGGLEYWPSGMNMLFDTKIEYILAVRGLDAPDEVLIRSKNPALITTIQRTCQLTICRDITFAEPPYSAPAPPIAQEQALLAQYGTLLFPLESDSDKVQNSGTPDVYAPDEAIWYDGSFVPNASYWRCKDGSPAYINIQATAPKNIRTTGVEVTVNLQRYGSEPVLQHVTWWMNNYDDLKEKI